MTRRFLVALVWPVSAVALAAQAPVAPPARDAAAGVSVPSGTGALAGIVIDGEKQPVRRTSVTISGDMRLTRRTVTDDAGRFQFVDLPAGRFTITAAKAGYPETSYGAKRPFRTGSGVMLGEGQRLTDIQLPLAKGAVLTGTVFDDRGQPMPGVPIMAWEVRTALSGERTLDMPATGGEWVTSDDRGMYRVFGLPPGEYTIGTAWFFSGGEADVRVPSDAEIRAAFLAVSQAGTTPPPGSTVAPAAAEPPRFNYTPVFYPSAVDPLAAATVTVAAGEERSGMDLHMQFRPMGRIEALVMGPDGPAGNAGFSMFRQSRVRATNSGRVSGTRPDGTYSSGSISPSDYSLLAEVRAVDGKPALYALASVTVSGDEPVKVVMNLQPSMMVTGKLAFEGQTLKPPADLTRVRVSLFANEGTPTSNTMQSTTDAAGVFSVVGVVPGQFRVNASVAAAAAPGGPAWTVKSVVADGRDVTDLPLTIVPGAAPAVTVTFTDQGAELSGALALPDGKPATDYFVVVLPADRTYWTALSRRIASTRPDGSGRYAFRNLPAGSYRIAVTTDLVTRDLQDVAALEQLAAQSAPVTLAFGEKRTFDIKVGG